MNRVSSAARGLRSGAILFTLLFLWGCSGGNPFRSSFDPNYQVRDGGGLDVVVQARACAATQAQAEREARKNAEFQLRKVVGAQRYLPRFTTIHEGYSGGQHCAEVQAAPETPER